MRRAITRRATAIAACAALAATIAAPSTALADYRGFSDLAEGQWYVDSGVVDWATDSGVIHGFPNGTWAPDAAIDREQAAAVLFNWSGDPAPSEPSTFDDADELGWAAGACAWAQDGGVFNGSANADGTVTMDPWTAISREQVATVLCNMFGEPADAAALDSYPDGNEVSDWARGTVAWGVMHGVLGANGEINPADGCTRAEFVTMLMRVVAGDGEGTPPVADPEAGAEWVWVPEYETVETPVYEQRWVEDTWTGPCSHYYCRWCGYDNDCYIPSRWNGSYWEFDYDVIGPWTQDGYWDKLRDDVLWHVQKNKCNCPPDVPVRGEGAHDGSIGLSRGTGNEIVKERTVDLGTGHYEQVQVGTKTETVEVGGHWEAR